MARGRFWMLWGMVWMGMVLLSGCRIFGGRGPEADLVLTNGIIHTMDNGLAQAEAAAVRDGRFVYVGTRQGVLPFIGKNTKVVDCEKRLVLPGFIDSHCHPISAFRQFYEINLYGLVTPLECQKAIKAFIVQNPKISHVRGRGWSNTAFPGTGPDKKDLDDVARDLPVKMSSEDGHSVWVNSKTLELAGITAQTEDPEGGVIERYPGTREPSGTLRENAADLVAGFFPGYSVEELMKGLEAYQTMALSFGITLAHDASLDVLPDRSSVETEAYRTLEKQNRLRMRFRASLYIDPGKGLEQVEWLVRERRKNQGPRFQTGGAKLFMDGVVEGVTAYLKGPYFHRPEWRGEPLWEQDAFRAMCAELDRNGFQIHVHSIGDAATSAVLDGLEQAVKKN
jgi:predicted amidohydrolase YtcJ